MRTIWDTMTPSERVIGLLVACVFWGIHWLRKHFKSTTTRRDSGARTRR